MLDPSDLRLFDTLVPISSIITVSLLIGYTLPKHEFFGLFILLWWTLSVYVSLQNDVFDNRTVWSPHDGQGMLVLLGVPTVLLAILYVWFQVQPKLRVFLFKQVPLWSLFALHVYRLDGLSIILPFWHGDIPKYLGLQMALLDVIIGATSIPLAWLVYSKGADSVVSGWQRDFVWFWNSLGLYDLASAYIVLLLNFFQIGGRFVTAPALAIVGFHPIPLIVMFQAPLAIFIHVFFLTSMDLILEKQSTGLPLHIQRLRAQ